MTVDEINVLVNKYFVNDGYKFPGHFEHRLDKKSSSMLYSMIREYEPKSILAVGTWYGGSTCLMMAALIKNNKPFNYVASELLEDMRKATELHCLEVNGKVPTLIGDITKNLDKVPKEIDFLFLDTDHDFETTDWIFKNIFPSIKKASLVAIHDWGVEELADGTWYGKGDKGVGGWDETNYLMERQKEGKLGLKKLFWTYKVTGGEEMSFWTKI